MTPEHARSLDGRGLAAAFAAGRRFDPRAITGWIYRGTSLGLPAWLERLTWTRFAKAFVPERGWNVRCEQAGEWRPRTRRGRPITFGAFAIVDGASGVELQYTHMPLRDPLVALDDRADTLLGRSLVRVGPLELPTPSYFLLERGVPVTAWAA